jgi:arylsulfatase A-like enzyme
VLLASGLTLLHFGLTGYWIPAPLRPTPPSVIVILIDTLRGDRLHASRNDVPVMPRLSALAREGRAFDFAVSPGTWTRPAIASLFTGLPFDAHGVVFADRGTGARRRSDNLSGEHETLAEYLRAYGYTTHGITTNGNVRGGTGFEQGFDAYAHQPYLEGNTADVVTKEGMFALNALQPPYFLYLHYMDPHGPYHPPEHHATAFGPVPEPTATDSTIFMSRDSFREYVYDAAKRARKLDAPRRYPPISEAGKARFRTLYDGECHFADAEVAAFIDAARQRHPEALIIVTSDHGEELWDHDGMGHGTTLYNEQLHVPLFILGPDIAPARVREPVSTLGLARTIAAYTGLPDRAHWWGQDLLADTMDAGWVYSRTRGPTPAWNLDMHAVIDGGTKVIRESKRKALERYDLESDPREQENLADVSATGADPYVASMERERRTARAQSPAGSVSKALDPETLRQLRDLGYLEDETGR